MPPVKKIDREDIIKVVLDILKNESIGMINARRIALELNSSVQPVFYNFSSMEDLKEEAYKRIYDIYKNYMIQGSKCSQAYKGMGLFYIKFAKDYPNYFKILFMNQTEFKADTFINDDIVNEIINKGMLFTGLSYKEQKNFHLKVWIFTHGLATMVATKTVNFTQEEIDKILSNTVREMLVGLKESRK